MQSRAFPVPLVAGEKALLRVFPTASRSGGGSLPDVRARFYRNGRETHVANLRGTSRPIPTEVDESSLDKSVNAEIPGRVIQPGLEMVIEVDPAGALDPSLGVVKRIPETGRMPVDIRAMPVFDLTLVPFIWTETGDESIVSLVREIAASPDTHELLADTRTLLPIHEIEVTAHEPVLSLSNDSCHCPRAWSQPESLSRPLRGPDPSFPYSDGSIGAWGYDFHDGGHLVPPSASDLMSYCDRTWISDYSFSNALRFRLSDADSVGLASPPMAAQPTKALLLWGGVHGDSVPFLEPAFVVEAPAVLPQARGDHRLAGLSADGREFSPAGRVASRASRSRVPGVRPRSTTVRIARCPSCAIHEPGGCADSCRASRLKPGPRRTRRGRAPDRESKCCSAAASPFPTPGDGEPAFAPAVARAGQDARALDEPRAAPHFALAQ